MTFYVLSIQVKKKNKTVRYLERQDVDYRVLVPNTVGSEIAESYAEKAIVYDVNVCKKYVDFCGTNIENGCAVGRVQSIIEAKKNKGISICLDDDYGNIFGNRPVNTYQKNQLFYVIEKLHKLQNISGIIFGGYSGGAMPNLKKNIMQIFILDSNNNCDDFKMILNEDVCYAIKNWHRGKGNFGLAPILRSGAQTAEMDKIEGNTQLIYATDRSYRKSFGSVLQDPNNARLTINRHNIKRGALWHNKIYWNKIAPKILDNGIRQG